ncbi:MAG: hypothetical protein OHK0021_11840 [Bryobacter sp.]
MQVLLLVTLLGFQNPTFGPDNPEGLVLTRNEKIRHAFQRKTFWKQVVTPTVIPSKPPLTAAERQQMNRALDQIIALLKATPEGSSGVGFWTNESRRLSLTNYDEFPRTYPPAKVPPAYESRLFPFYHEDSLQSNGQWRLSNKGETESVSFVFNQLPHPRYGVVIAQEEAPAVGLKIDCTLRPKLTGTWQGYPVYADSILVVTRPGRDPWAPLQLRRAQSLHGKRNPHQSRKRRRQSLARRQGLLVVESGRCRQARLLRSSER